MSNDKNPLPVLLRRSQVQRITNLATSTLYRDIARGDFPRPVLLTGRAVAWRASEVEQWLNDRQISGGTHQKRKGALK